MFYLFWLQLYHVLRFLLFIVLSFFRVTHFIPIANHLLFVWLLTVKKTLKNNLFSTWLFRTSYSIPIYYQDQLAIIHCLRSCATDICFGAIVSYTIPTPIHPYDLSNIIIGHTSFSGIHWHWQSWLVDYILMSYLSYKCMYVSCHTVNEQPFV